MAAQAVLNVLVVNAGSSSLKLALLGAGDELVAERELAAPRSSIDAEARAALRDALADGLADADVVGHRIVHGGERFREAVRIDGGVRAALSELIDLAPLHQPKSLDALDAVSEALPRVPAVACFDTAFHATLSDAAATFALPAAWRAQWSLRRYGFHGLSHAYVARRVPELLADPVVSRGSAAPEPDPADLRIVSCHLGAGASLCAIRGGRSVDTTMGFTPLDGLVMATRSGRVDPGLLLWLLEHTGMPERELARALEHESGLLGLSGTDDMREVLQRAAAGEGPARLALGVYLHRLRAEIGAMSAALGGLDVLVFTGGVGERSPDVRAGAVDGLGYLGVAVDGVRNTEGGATDREITHPRAPVRVLVVGAREDLEVARQARAVLRR